MSTIAVPRDERNYMGGKALKLRAQQTGGGHSLLQRVMSNHAEPRRASSERMTAQRMAENQPRYRIGDGKGRFLSIDGKSVVTDKLHSWFGSARQAEKALERFAAARGMRALLSLENKLPRTAQPFL